MPSKLIVELQDDGTVKINASGMEGDEAEILAELNALAKEVGGELEVEKHLEGVKHSHSHSHKHKIGHRH